MRRSLAICVLILVFAMVAASVWVSNNLGAIAPKLAKNRPVVVPSVSQPPLPVPDSPTAAETLLEGYGEEATPPLEDLRKIQRVATGYFSLVKDPHRFPIGGNADFSAALRGENPNREVYVRPGHPAFSSEGLLIDRWGTPLVVHPEGWKRLGLRSAGPDRVPHNADDLVLSPSGDSGKGGEVPDGQ